jgi:carboxypeptidase PM20D1
VGVAEKGYATIEMTVESEGGHSMMPPQQTAIGILSAAIDRIEHVQFPKRMETPIKQMFETLAPEMPFGMRMIFANLWLFEGLINKKLASAPRTNALIRTTTAPTIFESGVKENILPTKARSVVNFRLLPGESIDSVMEHVRSTIDDPRVEIRPSGVFNSEPSFISDTGSPAFKIVERTIRQVFPQVLAAPGLCIGATDSRHYAKLTGSIFRFSPLWLHPDDLQRIHGIDERISIENYTQVVMFYMQLIRNSNSMGMTEGAST